MKIITVALVLALCACGSKPKQWLNQKRRSELFLECLKASKGPDKTHYNDQDETIEACGQQAYFQSIQGQNCAECVEQ